MQLSGTTLVNLSRPERLERELDASPPLDAEEHVRQGMAPREARRTALVRLGGHGESQGTLSRRLRNTLFYVTANLAAGPHEQMLNNASRGRRSLNSLPRRFGDGLRLHRSERGVPA